MVTLEELQVRTLGECRYDSPLSDYVAARATNAYYVAETDRVLIDDTISLLSARGDTPLTEVPSFEPGGPRRKIFFDPR